jgi:iron complex outermembrane receptor protein
VLDLDHQDSLSEDLFNVLDDVTHNRNTGRLNAGVRLSGDDGNSVVDAVVAIESVSDELDDAYDVFGNHISAQNRQYNFNDLRLGYSLRFSTALQLKINVGQYHRVPYLYELYGDRGFFHGNSDLKPESSENIDVGIDYYFESSAFMLGGMHAYFGVFNNKSKDLIVRTYNSQGVGVSENIEDAIIRGLETKLIWPFIKNHTLNFNMALTDTEIVSDTSGFNGGVVPGQFAESYMLAYSFQNYYWLFHAEYLVKNGMYYDRTNLLRAEDREIINLSLKRSVNNQIFEVSVTNLMDNRYEDYNGYPKPGRILYLGYTYNF